MTIYKRCPFCEALFEIGPDDDEPMRQHIRAAHTDEDDDGDGRDEDHGREGRERGRRERSSQSACTFEDVQFGLRGGGHDGSVYWLLVALLYKREVLVPVLAQWYGVPERTVDAQFDRLDTHLFGREEEDAT